MRVVKMLNFTFFSASDLKS